MQEEPLKTDKQLYTTGFLQQFSDQIIQRYISLLAIAAGATVDQTGYLNAARTIAINLLQLPFGNIARAASSCLIYPIATNWTHIALVEAISRLGIASWLSAQSTYIIDIAPPMPSRHIPSLQHGSPRSSHIHRKQPGRNYSAKHPRWEAAGDPDWTIGSWDIPIPIGSNLLKHQ